MSTPVPDLGAENELWWALESEVSTANWTAFTQLKHGRGSKAPEGAFGSKRSKAQESGSKTQHDISRNYKELGPV